MQDMAVGRRETVRALVRELEDSMVTQPQNIMNAQVIAAIRNSTEAREVLAARYGVEPADIDAIKDPSFGQPPTPDDTELFTPTITLTPPPKLSE